MNPEADRAIKNLRARRKAPPSERPASNKKRPRIKMTSPQNPNMMVSDNRWGKETACIREGKIYRRAGGNRKYGGCVKKPTPIKRTSTGGVVKRKERADKGIPRDPNNPIRQRYEKEKKKHRND